MTITAQTADTRLFSFTDDVPANPSSRWFVRRGAEVSVGRGFNSKAEASQWIEYLGRRVDWRVGFLFRLRGDTTDIEIVDRKGTRAKP